MKLAIVLFIGLVAGSNGILIASLTADYLVALAKEVGLFQ